jgi:streptogramin lyase
VCWPDGTTEAFAHDLGVACGLAFAPDGMLFVGDRSGTIFRVDPNGHATTFATLPASVAAFHLAIGPDGALYVSRSDAVVLRSAVPHRAQWRRSPPRTPGSGGRKAWPSIAKARST